MSVQSTLEGAAPTKQQQRTSAGNAAELSALESLSQRAKSTTAPPLPTTRKKNSTVPPKSETIASPAPLADEDIELIEESGLLEIEVEASSSSNDLEKIVELTQSILIDDVEGTPPKQSDVTVVAQAPDMLGEEIVLDDEILDETEIGEQENDEQNAKPSRPVTTTAVIATADALTALPQVKKLSTPHEAAIASGLAQYSEGIPSHILTSAQAKSASSNRNWWRIAIVGIVFVAGVGGGIFFAGRSNSTAESNAASLEASSRAQQTQLRQSAEVPKLVVAPLTTIDVAPLVIDEPFPAQDSETPNLVRPHESVHTKKDSQTLPSSAAEGTTAPKNTDSLPKPKTAQSPEPKKGKKTKDKANLVAKKPTQKATVKSTSETNKASPTPATSQDPGVLMLASKPPSTIIIDGKATGLTTPQTNLRLSPGKHRITLVNKEFNIRDTFSVSMSSGKKLKRIRNNTNKIK